MNAGGLSFLVLSRAESTVPWRCRPVILFLLASVLAAPGSNVDVETAALIEGFASVQAGTNGSAAAAPANSPGPVINDALRDSQELIASTNLHSRPNGTATLEERARALKDWEQRIELARRQRLARLYSEAAPTFVAIVLTNSPESMKRTALLELALIAQEENNLAKAQQIFAHYLAKWPEDASVPEVILRQGLIFRQMGLNNLALTKFYSVMTSSLVLKSDRFDYYQRLVLQAQTEIAETYFLQGKHQDSAEYFTRLLKLDSPFLNRPQVHFKLIRSLSALGRHEEVTAQATDFISRYGDAVEQPEVRFYLATALKQIGRKNESLQQVLFLLQDRQSNAPAHPAAWAYWQQRTGNEIANQLYKEGDYLRALEVYSGLATLSTNVDWRLPVNYQIGLTFERLQQPLKAIEQYTEIVSRERELTPDTAPGLRAILDMARWRQQHLLWRANMEATTRDLKDRPIPTIQTARP